LRKRATLLRRLAKLYITTPPAQQDTPGANANIINEINHITNILTIPPTLETTLHKPLRHNITLCLPTNTSNPPTTLVNLIDDDILTCYKEHHIAKRLTIKHANIICYNKYGSALLQMFIRKPRDTLKSIIKTALNNKKHQQHTTPTNILSIRDPITKRIHSDLT